MKLFTRIYLSVLLFASLFLSGCIAEDLSDCPTGLKIYFTYDPATYARTGIEPSEVKWIDVYAFDSRGIFRGVWIEKDPILSPDYYLSINNLPTGDYRFIAWGGSDKSGIPSPGAFVPGTTTFNEAILALEHSSGVIDSKITKLFHAETTAQVYGNDQRIDMPLKQVYNTLNLTTGGLLNSTDTYSMTVYDNNGNYYFDSSFAPDSDFKYTMLCNKDTGGQLSASLDVLKLAADRNPVIEITNDTQGTTLFKENLAGLINAGGFDYDNLHVFDIHLEFGLSVSVSVNGWTVIDEGNLILN